MFRMLWANSASQLKNNLQRKVPFISLLVININVLASHSLPQRLLIIAFTICVFLWAVIDIRVPKILYICPISYENRKNYVKKVFAVRNILFPAINLAGSFGMLLTGAAVWYPLLIQNLLFVVFIWIFNLMTVIQTISETGADRQRTQWIGWPDTIGMVIGLLLCFFAMYAIYEERPSLSLDCIWQWSSLLAGFVLAVWLHRRNYKLLVAVAASYEMTDALEQMNRK